MTVPRPFRRPVLLALLGLSLVTLAAACNRPPAPGAAVTLGMQRASAGLCHALAGLPDTDQSSRTFTNEAHDQLHLLAADQRLDRSLQASVLQAMQQVEADYAQEVGAGVLYGDLQALKDRTDRALQAIGEEVPACDG